MQRALDQRDGLDRRIYLRLSRLPAGCLRSGIVASAERSPMTYILQVLTNVADCTQLIDYYRADATRDGVFGIWYGKGHGVDRSGDVFRQANIQGTAQHGGVLALAGDDHSAESSMFAHQTDQIFEAAIMPVLFPSSVEEYLWLGLAGIALSRFCGLWVGFKTITDTVESGATICVPELPTFVTPEIDRPPHGRC